MSYPDTKASHLFKRLQHIYCTAYCTEIIFTVQIMISSLTPFTIYPYFSILKLHVCLWLIKEILF